MYRLGRVMLINQTVVSQLQIVIVQVLNYSSLLPRVSLPPLINNSLRERPMFAEDRRFGIENEQYYEI